MSYFAANQNYILQWPPKLLTQELERLIRRGQEWGTDTDWVNEVRLLLGQAFESQIPEEDFMRCVESPPLIRTYGQDEEPF